MEQFLNVVKDKTQEAMKARDLDSHLSLKSWTSW